MSLYWSLLDSVDCWLLDGIEHPLDLHCKFGQSDLSANRAFFSHASSQSAAVVHASPDPGVEAEGVLETCPDVNPEAEGVLALLPSASDPLAHTLAVPLIPLTVHVHFIVAHSVSEPKPISTHLLEQSSLVLQDELDVVEPDGVDPLVVE